MVDAHHCEHVNDCSFTAQKTRRLSRHVSCSLPQQHSKVARFDNDEGLKGNLIPIPKLCCWFVFSCLPMLQASPQDMPQAHMEGICYCGFRVKQAILLTPQPGCSKRRLLKSFKSRTMLDSWLSRSQCFLFLLRITNPFSSRSTAQWQAIPPQAALPEAPA